jgi:hypothetical protein
MFDLEADPGETRDVSRDPQHRRQREALHTELTRYFADNGAPPIEDWRKSTHQKLPAESARRGPGI